MKKKILAILFAILVGGILAFPVLSNQRKPKNSSVISMYILQTGVFKDFENAKEEQAKIKNSVIYKDNDIYRVLVGASTNETSLMKVEEYLKEEQIHYYKKEIEIYENNIDLFSKYNVMLEKAEEKETILLLNQKILEKMVSV